MTYNDIKTLADSLTEYLYKALSRSIERPWGIFATENSSHALLSTMVKTFSSTPYIKIQEPDCSTTP